MDPAKGTLKLLWEEEWRGLGITQVSGIPRQDLQIRAKIYVPRAWAGSTMKYMSQNRTYCSSSMEKL